LISGIKKVNTSYDYQNAAGYFDKPYQIVVAASWNIMLGIGVCNPLIMHLFRAWIAIPRLLGYIINCVSIRNVFGKVFIAMEGFYNMISYVRQVPICQSVRKAIEESFTESGDASFRAKIGDIPHRREYIESRKPVSEPE
jgi:hypothetical protein